MENASRWGSRVASVTTAKVVRIPTTTTTTTVCARATACEPSTFNAVMATTTSTANTLAQAALPSATAEPA